MRLLVTGGLGFIASNFIRYVLSKYRDVKIKNVDSVSITANPANLEDIRKDPRYSFVKGDISNFKLTSKLVKGVDVILNAAAETHVDRSIANPGPFVRSNVVGTYTVLEAARRNCRTAKIVQVSTDETYGEIPEGSFIEDDRLKPSNPYAATKAAADMFALAYHRTYGLNVTVTRCTNNFGPFQHPEKLIPKAIIRANLNLPVPVYGKGKQIRDWIYVIDHCDALIQVMEKGEAGEIYNISAGNEMTTLQIAKSIVELLRKPKDLVQFVEDRPGHDVRYSLDSSKIISELGWKPKHAFTEGLDATVQWYVNNEAWWRPQASKKLLHPTPWKIRW